MHHYCIRVATGAWLFLGLHDRLRVEPVAGRGLQGGGAAAAAARSASASRDRIAKGGPAEGRDRLGMVVVGGSESHRKGAS